MVELLLMRLLMKDSCMLSEFMDRGERIINGRLGDLASDGGQFLLMLEVPELFDVLS